MRRKKIRFRRIKFISFKTKASTRLGILALFFTLVVVFLGKSIGFIKSLNEPMNKDSLSQKSYSWNQKTSINIAFKSSNVSLLHFDPISQQIVILNIPNETYFELPRGFGSWSVGSIYDLGQEEKPPIGSELLKQSLSSLLGLPVDGFITLDATNSSSTLDTQISSWKRNPLKIISFVRSIKSDLTPLEAIALFRSLSNVRSDKISYLDIAQSDITQSKLLPDSSRVLGVDTINLDLFIRSKMPDEKITEEGESVAVFNATDHPGLATLASRLVTNMGGDVIFTSNSEQLQDKSVVVGNVSDTTSRLTQIFAPDCLNSKCFSNDPRVQSSRAQINIILGEDFFKNQ